MAYDQAILLFTREYRRQRAKACERRNAGVPLHQLPLELLVEILLLSVSESSWRKEISLFGSVCGFGKTIVDTSPRFWAYIDLIYGPDITKYFLCNSKSVPLTVTLVTIPSESVDLFPQLVAPLFPHTHRIKSLELETRTRSESIIRLISSPFPALRNLAVHILEDESPSSLQFTLPAAIPALQSLSLVNTRLHWAPIPSPNLRYIELVELPNSPSVPIFLDILSNLPLLESVTLRSWDRVREEGASQVQQQAVHLPHLKTLILARIPHAITRAMLANVVGATYRRFEVADTPLDLLLNGTVVLEPFWAEFEAIQVLAFADRRRAQATNYIISRPILQDTHSPSFKIDIQVHPPQWGRQLEETLQWLSAMSSTAIQLKVGEHLSSFDDYFMADYLNPDHSAPLTLSASVASSCPSVISFEVGSKVNVDEILDYLSEPDQDEAGTRSWRWPNLEVFNLKSWSGDQDKLKRLGKARWEVPGDVAENGLVRSQLKQLVLPETELLRDDVQSVLWNCAPGFPVYGMFYL